jgi:hypothetical protein
MRTAPCGATGTVFQQYAPRRQFLAYRIRPREILRTPRRNSCRDGRLDIAIIAAALKPGLRRLLQQAQQPTRYL